MIITELLSTHFPETYLSLNKRDKCAAVETTLLYAFNGMNVSEFTKIMRPLAGERIIDYRMALQSTGRMYQAKTFLFRAYAKGNLDRVFAESDLRVRDVKLKRWVRRRDSLSEVFEGFLDQGYLPVSWGKLQRAIVSNLPHAKKYAAYKVGKDLAFVVSAGQSQRDELIDELVLSAIQGVYKTYPRIENAKHMLNIMKRTITNACTNLQYHHTTASRKAMHEERDTDGQIVYRNVIQKIDLVKTEHPNMIVRDTPETGFALSQLRERYAGKRLYYIDLITGKFDADFSNWLAQRGYNHTNDVLLDELLASGNVTEYCNLAGLFLKLPEGGSGFNERLRQDMGGKTLATN